MNKKTKKLNNLPAEVESALDGDQYEMIEYNKLVRDGMPIVVALDGNVAGFRVLEGEEFLQELLKKLDEEIAEFKAGGCVEIEELADIAEVVAAIGEYVGAKNSLAQAMDKKRQTRGRFRARLFMTSCLRKKVK